MSTLNDKINATPFQYFNAVIKDGHDNLHAVRIISRKVVCGTGKAAYRFQWNDLVSGGSGCSGTYQLLYVLADDAHETRQVDDLLN